ncbi:hypothetical protein D5S18_03075 [Nocardia panacis]|uniref:HTH cro/C1-type domain-containing protein n=1 Tax=Nocardia panacis TaxID=2340916 RepID=A0A3A4KF20_9NOCA|nr:helix-turn-helix domain-containing protein [Nocardia panacis]RJO79328.1 hypothetical protein D5S18_03075 [Nocardia panacis]
MATTLRIKRGVLDQVRTRLKCTSDRQFADLLGVSRETLRRMRSGQPPSAEFITALAVASGWPRNLNKVIEIVEQQRAA